MPLNNGSLLGQNTISFPVVPNDKRGWATLCPRQFLNMYFNILSFLREEDGKVEAREEGALWRKRNIGFSLSICKYKCIQYHF